MQEGRNSLMGFRDLESLLSCFRSRGVRRVYAKQLAENDNCKQQIYLGGSFEVLGQLPFTAIREEPGGRRPNFKASLNLHWIDSIGNAERANGAQLILYPDYPEVRLSGFLRGCSLAPSSHLQPVPPGQRQHNSAPDGRILFFGVTDFGSIYVWLAARDTPVATEFPLKIIKEGYEHSGVFWHVPIVAKQNNRNELIAEIRRIHQAGWHPSKRLTVNGEIISYTARNGGGYTLEALLGVKPNAVSAPDFLGYEIKAYSTSKVTLMTPEPNVGFYGTEGVEAFVRRYGHPTANDTLYFTGAHRVGQACPSSGQTLELDGFDPTNGKILDVSGGIMLRDSDGNISAGWSFKGLIEHWGRKHASAAYVPYASNGMTPISYQYRSPILIGEGTNFEMYLKAMHQGKVIYDPGSKVTGASTGKSQVKARSQFRIAIRELSCLYRNFESVPL